MSQSTPSPAPATPAPSSPDDDAASSAISEIPSGLLTELDAPSNTPTESPPPVSHARAADVAFEDDAVDEYKGFDWARFPSLQKPSRSNNRPSWIWKYGYRCQKRASETIMFVCKYCHKHKIFCRIRPAGVYDVTKATSAVAIHLASLTAGYRFNKDRKI